MEEEYRQVQEECQELQLVLEQRDEQLCSLNQELLDLTLRMKVSLLHVHVQLMHTTHGYLNVGAQQPGCLTGQALRCCCCAAPIIAVCCAAI